VPLFFNGINPAKTEIAILKEQKPRSTKPVEKYMRKHIFQQASIVMGQKHNLTFIK